MNLNKILHFEATIYYKNRPEYFIFLFNGPEEIEHEDLSNFIQHKQIHYITPKNVIILQALPHKNSINKKLRSSNSNLNNAIDRGARNTNYIIAYYDKSGTIKEITPTKSYPEKSDILKLLKNNIINIKNAGLHKINSIKPSLTKAPQGFHFSKPSSRKSNYFIRTEDLLNEAVNTQFIAFCCLTFIHDFESLQKDSISTLFVDTMGIASIAFSILLFRKIFEPELRAADVISFHSHDGLESDTVDLGTAQSSICLISASTHCALAKRWIDKTHTKPNQVLTLVSFEKNSSHTQILFSLEPPEDYEIEGSKPPEEDLKFISLQGERFQLSHSHPKSLNISTKHAPETLSTQFEKLHSKNLFSCFSQNLGSKKKRAIYLNTRILIADENFKNWFGKKIKESVPASLSIIIHDDDESSKALAEMSKSILGEKYTNTRTLSFENFKEDTQFHGSALILSCVAERGSKLLSVSRKLRHAQENDSGTRIYLIGAILGKSIKHIGEIKANLKQPPKDSEAYKVLSFLEFPTGNHYSTAHWENELKLLQRMQFNGAIPDQLTQRADAISNSPIEGLWDNAFYPSSVTSQPLRLRNGFAFADNVSNINNCSAGDVFLIMSWILQHARQSTAIPDSLKLSSDELRQVVISPEIFSRYDDGIIQACILRAANPSELDYRASEDLSDLMRELCYRILTGYGAERGEAALEFALALAIKKIKLTPTTMEKLVSDIKDFFDNDAEHLVLQFINSSSSII